MIIDIEKIINETPFIWDDLNKSKNPTLIYGTGNGADKIIDLCEAHGVTVSGIFASDGFVRNRDFRGHHIISYSDAIAKFGCDINILAAFGSTLPDVMERFYALDSNYNFYLPYAPLYGGEIFTPDMLKSSACKIERTAAMLSDDRSVKLLEDVIRYRLSGKIGYLTDTEDPLDSYRDLFNKDIKKIIDLGAYKGDSAQVLIESFPSCKSIVALEPDRKSFAKLSLYAQNESRCEVIPVNAAISNKSGEEDFRGGGSRGSAINGAATRADDFKVRTVTLDELSKNFTPDLIKLDTEGKELEALIGGEVILKTAAPSLALSLYHKSCDLFTLPLMIEKHYRDRKFYLRRAKCIPDWDITLFVV